MQRFQQVSWLGREDSNLRMVESKSTALPLGDAPCSRPAQQGWSRARTIVEVGSGRNGMFRSNAGEPPKAAN